MRLPLYLLAALALLHTGCTRLRFVVDVTAPEDPLTETVVLEDGGGGAGGDKIAMIEVCGLISDTRTPRLLAAGDNPVSRFAESLERARRDGRVKAVILRINSPGGMVGATEQMHRELQHFKRETGKPVVVVMGDVAASGGYYLACGGDRIIALPSTVTGSIGVIMQTINFSEGMQRIGIRADAITSGPNKAVGSPFQPMAAEHRQLLQDIVDEMYVGFRAVVEAGRPGIGSSELDWIADGRVVTGARAAELGLVDQTGDLRDGFAAAKAMSRSTSARLVKYHRTSEFVGSAWAQAPGATGAQVNLMQVNLEFAGLEQPGFYYLWTGGN